MELLAVVFRRGWQTSEFWITLAGLASVIYLRGDGRAQLLTAAIAIAYVVTRGVVKGRAARSIIEAETEPKGPRRV